ncbi:universal stress protein [Candidatus Methylomirabilis sp.]|uniref:universal stress protein n=1 Tax=Candidatus Methylomirabilis sp. TaxID=2032687 RepID=UPI002A5D4912|nr:universal stress protein [Candidatus Methylomirabilis sp.]
MITLKKILVPTDFSETAKVALTYARALASTYHGSVHVLHVLPDASVQPWAFGVETETMGLSTSERLKRWEQKANEQMKNLLSETERKQLDVRFVTQVGHPVQQILQYAKDQAVDLIVMGTHGRGTPAPTSGGAFPWNVPMGSVAERVVRQAPCPVLTVRHPEHEFVTP